MDSESQKIIIVLGNIEKLNPINELLPKNYLLENINSYENLYFKIIGDPEKYKAIIIARTDQGNLEILYKISTCSRTKTIPIIIYQNKYLSSTQIESYTRAGVRYCLPYTTNHKAISNIILAAVRDRERYLIAENNIIPEHASNVMLNGEFKFQTLWEAQIVANFIAEACPNPRLAVVGISEMFINAIEHGNLDISYTDKTRLNSSGEIWLDEVERRLNLPENKNKYVIVKFNRENSHININIKDEGNGFNWQQYQQLDASRVYDNHGRGIVMARNLAFEKLEFIGNGNEVNCMISLAPTKKRNN